MPHRHGLRRPSATLVRFARPPGSRVGPAFRPPEAPRDGSAGRFRARSRTWVFEDADEKSHSVSGPRPRRARRFQAFQAADTIRTMLGRLFQGVSLRSSTSTRPRSRARRSVARTVDRETPAIAATASWQSRRSPRFRTSAATTASTACSARVKRAASCGGSRPDDAQRRRRSIEASVRGREPTRAAAGAAAGTTFRASMRAEISSASASLTCPCPKARHSSAASSGSLTLGDASTARLISSANKAPPSGS